MEYISMILGLAIVVTLMIRNWSPVIIGIAAAAVVIFLNGMPYGDTMSNVFFPAFAGMFESLFPVILSGSLIAETYKRSGAVVVIADKLCNLMFRDGLSPTKRYVAAILSMVIVSGVICFCGMNSLVMLMAMYPIALRIMERADIPKRFVMGILSGGVYTFAMSAPGSAEVVSFQKGPPLVPAHEPQQRRAGGEADGQQILHRHGVQGVLHNKEGAAPDEGGGEQHGLGQFFHDFSGHGNTSSVAKVFVQW